jgi:hypothetical protein
MRFRRSTGLVLASLATAGAPAVAKAALPEFIGVPNTFTASGGTVRFETTAGVQLTCTSTSASGEVTSSNLLSHVGMLLKGCKAYGVLTCTSKGGAPGEIFGKSLQGGIAYIAKAAEMVGADLAGSSGIFYEFECTGATVGKVRGGVIGKIAPVNTKTKTFTITYTQSKGKQGVRSYEGGAVDILEASVSGGAFEALGEENSITLIFASETEIRA